MKRAASELRKRVYEIIDIGYAGDGLSRFYDIFITVVILVNLGATILYTFDGMEARFGPLLLTAEWATVIVFAVDYVLRVWTADQLYKGETQPQAGIRYALSLGGVIDLFSFLPAFLPFFFPAGVVAFRMFRVIRIFRLFRINAYYDSLNVITEVISGKRQQLLSSVFIIIILMIGASLCMYSLENAAQPDVFRNAFSGIWWAASTLLTVGYGDIYPITTVGKIFGIIITFLGVGMVAIPTGIISAGFVEQYTRLKTISEEGEQTDIRFIRVPIGRKDPWKDKAIRDLAVPSGMIIAAVRRAGDVIIPHGSLTLKEGDTVVIGAADRGDGGSITLKCVELKSRNPWNGQLIRDLDISRRTLIVMVKRGGRTYIPRGDMRLLEGDTVYLYTKTHMPEAEEITI